MLIWQKQEIDEAARLLSREQGDVRTRRATERLMMRTPSATWLYRVRFVQCVATTASVLQGGQVPKTDLWVPWLNVRDPEVPLAEWKKVEESLVDPVVALERWWDVGKLWQDMVLAPQEARQAWILEEEVCDALLVHFCLAVEECHRSLGGEEGVESAELAVWIADNLLDRHRHARPSMTARLGASVLTDLLALAWARLANAYRILGRIPAANGAMSNALLIEWTVELAPWVAGEVASLHASLLKDEGLDLKLAEKRVDHAIAVFKTFDPHLAARMRVLKAEIERLHENDAYLSTLRQAAKHLDPYRDTCTAEVATTNVLFYLVREGRIRRAALSRYTLSWPTLPAQLARRLCVEGCIELALGRPDLAEVLLADSARRYTKLTRLGDAMVALLYLATACLLSEQPQRTRDHLAAALHFAQTGDYPAAGMIGELLESLETNPDHAARIQEIAYEAGGCLGPDRTEAEASD
jgi:hypothetical protein